MAHAMKGSCAAATVLKKLCNRFLRLGKGLHVKAVVMMELRIPLGLPQSKKLPTQEAACCLLPACMLRRLPTAQQPAQEAAVGSLK
jgi:hypothetical protein